MRNVFGFITKYKKTKLFDKVRARGYAITSTEYYYDCVDYIINRNNEINYKISIGRIVSNKRPVRVTCYSGDKLNNNGILYSYNVFNDYLHTEVMTADADDIDNIIELLIDYNKNKKGFFHFE